MKLHDSFVRDVSSQIYKQLYSLNMRAEGLMRGSLVDARHCTRVDEQEFNYRVMYFEEDGVILAWCLYMPQKYEMYTRPLGIEGCPTKAVSQKRQKCVQLFFWTRMKYRGQGLGKKLGLYAASCTAAEDLGVCKVHPWDAKSRKLMTSISNQSVVRIME